LGAAGLDAVEGLDATTWFDPVSVSFGQLRANRPFSQTRTVRVVADPAAAASAVIEFASAPPAGLSLTATLSGPTISLTMTIDRTVPNGDYSGDVEVSSTDGETYLIPFFVRASGRSTKQA
jgi:hypothetical protein